jgi:hypothetical protein
MATLRMLGAKLGATIGDEAIEPGTLLVGCDLRAVNFDGKDLRDTRFVGCLLSGATMRGAKLQGAQLVGCFAPEDWAPVVLADTSLAASTVRDCHLSSQGAQPALASRWPTEAVVAAKLLTSDDARDRNEALRSLATQRFVPAAPLIAYCLEDGEWDVRMSALATLVQLRGVAFPEHDATLLEWMFYALGDEHLTVADFVVEQIGALRPGDAVLRASMDQIAGPTAADKLAGLRAARRLVHADRAYLRLLDVPGVQHLARSGDLEARIECMRLAGYLGGAEGLQLVVDSLSDHEAAVRTAALAAVALLDDRPHALQLAKLLTDPSEEVRVATVYALNRCSDFSTGLLTRATVDVSPKVREAVIAVLEDRRAPP